MNTPKYCLSFLFFSILNAGYSQRIALPVEIAYWNSKILSETATNDTILDIPVKFTTYTIEAGQRIQTLCNYGKPESNRYDSVHVTATVSYMEDSTGNMKEALYQYFLKDIDEAEKYAASNNFKASIVSKCTFYQIDSLNIPGIRTANSKEGNYVIWYIDGYVYKITLIEDNGIGSLRVLLRNNIRLKRNNKFLDADNEIIDIEKVKEFLNEWQ